MATAGPPQDGSNGEAKSASTEPTSLCYQLINKESQIKPALEEIRLSRDTSPMIAVDCEGEELSRKGKLSLVSIATEDHIYLFDVEELGASVFDKGLRDILEDATRGKLMFDCREDSDCLTYQFNVKLANVLDLQLLKIIQREDKEGNISEEHPRVDSFLSCLKEYVKDKDLIKAKEAGPKQMHTTDIWTERPLSDVMLQYAASDVRGFFKLYGKLKIACDGHSFERLRVASEKYLNFFRSRPSRSYDRYETNSFLPMYIVPPKGSLGFPVGCVRCVGCNRDFPSADFSKTQLRKRTPRCPVCKEIKLGFDIQANREDNWARERDYSGDDTCYDSEPWYAGRDHPLYGEGYSD